MCKNKPVSVRNDTKTNEISGTALNVFYLKNSGNVV